ncbi:DEAD/DEAH box helicase family protein [Streptomyces sp. 2231.1]|uniref:DEAD/DEAH box helicase family protein n=1 Tax=Streptomyces sp. 2231.1 TaxID=1855347 RepID=UPI000A58579D|nr:DEAD/DEAH box helicase family protein [Streptomyces sp. 2231.1]
MSATGTGQTLVSIRVADELGARLVLFVVPTLDLTAQTALAWRGDGHGEHMAQPIWKRPRKPKSKAAKKQELRKQRRRLQDAGKRRLAAAQSRRPRSRQNRIGNAATRRDARALSRVRHSTAWLL